jgi:putative spermidine/putrescine transport system substrate-binding protein
MPSKHNQRKARRRFLIAGTSAMAAMAVIATAGLAAEQVIIASWGGSYQAAQSDALFKPASEKTGVQVIEETYGGMSDVRLKVNANAMTWDIVASGSGSAARAGIEGLLEPLDYTVIDVSAFPKNLYSKYCVGGDVFSVVAAWNTGTYGDKGPQSWADFFDVQKFPGKRAYRNKVPGALEPAVMADGVPADKVYEVLDSEEGIKRAIDKIRQLKPDIAVWWSSGAQHAQLMKDGEVDMTTGWNGRFDVARKDGAKVAYTFNQALLDYDCFAIPKGAPNMATAMTFLAEISKAEYQANLPKYITYGPTNAKAYDLGTIDEAVAKTLPSYPANAALQLPISLEWYEKWEQKAAEMYQEMVTE